jgi:hypothetical protein
MMSKLKWVGIVVSAFLAGCSTYSETKSPCDYYGSFCGTKQSINH